MLGGCISESTSHRDEVVGSLLLRRTTQEYDRWSLGGCGHRHSESSSLSLVTSSGKDLVEHIRVFFRSKDDHWGLAGTDGPDGRNSLKLVDLRTGSLRGDLQVDPPCNLTVWLERDRVQDSPWRHRILLSGVSTTNDRILTDSLWIITFTSEGASLNRLFHEAGKQVRVVDEPWSPDESSIGVLVRTPRGREESTALVQIPVTAPGFPRILAESDLSWSDMAIEWRGSRPFLKPKAGR